MKSDAQKMKAIRFLLTNGSRGSEWQEAGLLCAIEKVVNEDCKNLSTRTLQSLLEEAKKY